MKAMPYKMPGGLSDLALRGQTANEVIKAQGKHLKDVVARGAEAHASAFKEMQGRWKDSIAGIGWYRKVERDFAALRKS